MTTFSLINFLDLFKHLFSALLLSTVLLTTGIKGDCVMYDVCNTNRVHDQNCPYNGPGFVLNDVEAEEILFRRCPDIFHDPSTPVCCTPSQVRTMESSIQMAEGIFGRCQTCLKNLLKGICGLACDQEQDKYISILEERYSSIYQKDYVHSVEYRVDINYTTGTYESCKQVVHPSSGRQAMELACGTEASKCDPDKWYFYMGDPTVNPLVPFKIEYVNSDDIDARFTADTKTCDEAYDNAYACSCVDCAESCPVADPPIPDDPGYRIFNLNGITFIIAVVIGSFGVVALLFGSVVFNNYNFKNLPSIFGGFDGADIWMSKFFGWWGRSKNDSLIKL